MDVTNSIDATVEIHGEKCPVTLYRRPDRKTTPWLATGCYRNAPIDAQGDSPQSALERWTDNARMIGDD